MIKVLYFGQIAELIGAREHNRTVPAGTTATALLTHLAHDYPQIEPISRLQIAINQHHASGDTLIKAGDEVAIFEPVTGG